MSQERRRTPAGYDYYLVRMQRVWHPPTDVYETDDEIVVKVEIPGMREEDFDITVVDRQLVISGKRPDPGHKLSYHNMEIQYGEFRTQVRVQWQLDQDAVEATYDNGFLYVRLPKARHHRVQVK
mgnify:CR=1 FL=1